MPTERICMSMILLEPAYKILHSTVKFKRRTISVTPFFWSLLSVLRWTLNVVNDNDFQRSLRVDNLQPKLLPDGVEQIR